MDILTMGELLVEIMRDQEARLCGKRAFSSVRFPAVHRLSA